jgi:sterol desaturase/sphingolipid hydroxylase (fatty acid hydroxylase superfamily)
MHVVPLFWRVHRVHHSDPMLDISTTVRFHPLEFIIQLVPNVIVIAALGLPAWALMVYELLDAAMNVFIHANVRLPSVVDRRLRLLLVTPDLHRVHHSADLLETNSNYGVTISAWDRLFHTYREEPFLGREGMTLGLKEHGDHAPGVAGLLFLPFRGESPQAALAA